MIRVKHSSGNAYYRSEELTTYTTVWNDALEIKGGMRFYEGDIKLIGDFRLGDQSDEILMISYPHNDKKNLLEIAERRENEIRQAIIAAMKEEPDRVLFAIDLAHIQIQILKKEHFNRFGSVNNPQDELFTFDNPDPKVGFPRMYLHEKSQRMSPVYGELFPVLAKVSRFAFPALDNKPTSDGARFTYMLFNSYRHLEFTPEVPNLTGVRWPTKLSCEIPMGLDTAELEKFLIEAGIDKLTIKDGKVIDPNEDEEENWEVADLPAFMFGAADETPQSESLRDQVRDMIDKKGYFNIGDAFNLGFDKVLSMVPISGKIIPANIDFPGLVRKMCIHKGLFYIVPLNDEIGRVSEILDLDEEAMMICTDDEYPKYNPPMLPAPEY